MAPIRLGIIGLASSDRTNAHLPYLLSPRGREKYKIVALFNSSIEAAKRAVGAYSLLPETKAYGDPEQLAADTNVDFVVCSARVDNHYKTILPSIKAGKSLFVEWPLAHNIVLVRKLVEAARESRSRTLVGVQGRVAPVHIKIRELLDEGLIGKVLSSEFRVADGPVGRDSLRPELSYFTEWDTGGNFYTIYFAHLWDQVQHILGEVEPTGSQFRTHRPQIKIIDPSTDVIIETAVSNVPDLITIAGLITSGSRTVVKGATISGSFRLGPPFPGEPRLTWSVHGEKGEIRLTAGSSILQANGYNGPVAIQVHDHETEKVETVEWAWSEFQESLPIPARNVATLYELFASGSKGIPDFESALRRHEQLEAISEMAASHSV
ncbi:oxidoreductase family protein [Colletotrichum tofieldiae]|uniref:Oxidoreductase family protein n=1 Tax=Colletotrichum tofieldiae TaxID=708197 RepID=A0A166P5Q8_9PEZI|nr:oxidoreductase family protein [Colletotrichum tofieldiae]